MIPAVLSLPLQGPRLQQPVLFSLLAHLAVGAVVFWWTTQERAIGPPPMRRSYSVDLVEPPGVRGGKARQTAPVPKTDVVRSRARTGVQVDQAPSTETAAPKGVKKPTRTPGQKGGEAIPSAGGKGKAGGEGLRLEVPFPYPEYLGDLKVRVEEQWQKPFLSGNLKATIRFNILKNGDIEDAVVEVGSGVLLFDRKALEAVENASPLPPLPEGFTGAQLGVHLDFENEE